MLVQALSTLTTMWQSRTALLQLALAAAAAALRLPMEVYQGGTAVGGAVARQVVGGSIARPRHDRAPMMPRRTQRRPLSPYKTLYQTGVSVVGFVCFGCLGR